VLDLYLVSRSTTYQTKAAIAGAIPRSQASHLTQGNVVLARQQFVKIDVLQLRASEPSGRSTLPSNVGRPPGIPEHAFFDRRAVFLVPKASRGPDDGFLSELGWGSAVLLILASSLALASLAWFLVGLLVN
jgi:hypothetical protein